MAGVKGKSGGSRPNSGRPARVVENDVQEIIGRAWPQKDREAVFKGLHTAAAGGNVRAAALLMAYAYGTPPSGDEVKIQEAIDAEFDTLKKTLEESLTPSAWAEVKRAMWLE